MTVLLDVDEASVFNAGACATGVFVFSIICAIDVGCPDEDSGGGVGPTAVEDVVTFEGGKRAATEATVVSTFWGGPAVDNGLSDTDV